MLLHQMSQDFSIRIRGKGVAGVLEFGFELFEIFYDAVVHDPDLPFAIAVGMCIFDSWLAVSGPAQMRDTALPFVAFRDLALESRDRARCAHRTSLRGVY